MGVPLEFWVETMKKHPALYRFEGLGSRRGGKDSFHKDVREACVADEAFMNDWMEQKSDGELEELNRQLAETPDPLPGPDADEYQVEAYANYLRAERWRDWEEPENINLAPARKVIEKLEPKDGEKISLRRWGQSNDAEAVRYAWSRDETFDTVQFEWDYIKQDDPSFYLKEHPPVEMWSHAYEVGIPLDEILMICPGCHSEPVREKDISRDPLRFYCGLCGSEACPDEGETLESWAEAVGVKLWPFEAKEVVDGKADPVQVHRG